MEIKNLPKNSFFEYYREGGQLKGVVLALSRELIGWSLCNKLDRFDKEKAIMIAYRRAVAGSKKELPKCLTGLYDKIVERASKYYK